MSSFFYALNPLSCLLEVIHVRGVYFDFVSLVLRCLCVVVVNFVGLSSDDKTNEKSVESFDRRGIEFGDIE